MSYTTTMPATFTPSFSTSLNLSSSSFMWYRRGQFCYIEGQVFWGGAGTASEFRFGLPSTFVIDPNYVCGSTSQGGATASIFGWCEWWKNTGTSHQVIWTHYASATMIGMWETTGQWWGSFAANTDSLNLYAKVPIQGWTGG